jgi:hypothetical protein
MKQLNENYAQMVTRDQQVNTGPFPWSMTPASHTHYFSNPEMAKPIAKSLAKTWRQMSGDGGPANPRSARIVVGQRRRGRPIPA